MLPIVLYIDDSDQLFTILGQIFDYPFFAVDPCLRKRPLERIYLRHGIVRLTHHLLYLVHLEARFDHDTILAEILGVDHLYLGRLLHIPLLGLLYHIVHRQLLHIHIVKHTFVDSLYTVETGLQYFLPSACSRQAGVARSLLNFIHASRRLYTFKLGLASLVVDHVKLEGESLWMVKVVHSHVVLINLVLLIVVHKFGCNPHFGR